MGGANIPGPLRTERFGGVDHGTHARIPTPTPTPIGGSDNVEDMSLEDRFREVLFMTAPKLPGEIREEFTAILTTSNLAIMVGVLAAWAVSHYFGVGFIVDALLIISGAVLIGWQIFTAADHLFDCVSITYSAKSRKDLDLAAKNLADFIAIVGVTAFLALLAKGAKKATTKSIQLEKTRVYYENLLGWKNKPDAVIQKLDRAIAYFRRNGNEIRQFEGGLKQEVMNSYIKGIDFSQDVIVKTLTPRSTTGAVNGTSSTRGLRLIQFTDQYQTNFFTVQGTNPGNLAIPKPDEKMFKVYQIVGNVEVLISKTAPMGKTLAVGPLGKRRVGPLMPGGAFQVIIPNPASNVRLIREGNKSLWKP